MKKYKGTIILIGMFIIICAFSYTRLKNPKVIAPEAISYTQFIQKINDKQVKSVEYEKDKSEISGIYKNGNSFTTDNPQTGDFKKYLLEHDIHVSGGISSNPWMALLTSIFNFVLTIAVFFFIISILSKKIIKSQTKYSSSIGSMDFPVTKDYSITFDDVAGNEEAKVDMMELVDFIKNPVKYKRYGATIPKGTILSGAPGTGKTLLAKALAGTANVPFISVSGSTFVEKFVGVGAARIRELFSIARKNAPCIVFIDEIDAVGKQRGGSMSGSNDERDQTLNQLLVEMDGFTGNEGIIIIAATNRLDMLDNALLRSGRFDRQIQVELPDLDARKEILKIHTRNKPLADEVDLAEVAKMTTYMSGADLKNVMNESSIYAARAEHKGITMGDIDRAINKVIAGEEKKNYKKNNFKDKEITAYHEAGHALVAKLLTKKSIPKVTIIPTTKGAGGYTMITPEERLFETKEDMLNEIAISLGGRVSEEIIFGEDKVTGGASQDLTNVTKIASRMVKAFGMSKEVGLVNMKELYGDSFYNGTTNDLVAHEVREIVEKEYEITKRLIRDNNNTLYNISQALLNKETVYEKDLDTIMQGLDIDYLPKKEGGIGIIGHSKGELV